MPLSNSIYTHNKVPLVLVLLSFLSYGIFAYSVDRGDYIALTILYTVLFILFYGLVNLSMFQEKTLTWIALGLRAVFIVAIPNLSQDFNRFIWDGRLLVEGINPYIHTVEYFIQKGDFPISQAQQLYNSMGVLNGSHFSNYPPINQLCFALAALFAGKSILGSVVILRLIIVCADFGTLYFGKKLLEKLELPSHNIYWYVLNPFIIIELTGNLHFEGVMIFFLVWSLYLLYTGKWVWAAFVVALSISVKLIPLMFLPLFYQRFVKVNSKNRPWSPKIRNLTKLVVFYGIVGISTLLLFLPFYFDGFIKNYSQTISLWFHQFEFNASLYYVVREIGYAITGYNAIDTIGKATPIVVVIFVLILTFFKKIQTIAQLMTTMLFVLSFYYFTATTVHPWYIATPLMLSIFTKYKFPLVWSFVVILSYMAYSNPQDKENLWIVALEYIILYGLFIYEVFIKKSHLKGSLIH